MSKPEVFARFLSYAQNFEDVMLWRALGDIPAGRYIDVGAADPVDMSVTNAFYQAGWRGINIEPALHYFDRLRTARPADVNLAVAIGQAPASRVFYEIPATGLSTLDGGIADGHRDHGWQVVARDVEVTTLAQICRDHAAGDIHFLKIDVEGAESEVLAGADFDVFRPWIVLLEATRPLTTIQSADWEPALLAAGYVFVWFDGLNRFYVARERHAALQRHFHLPPNSFDNFDKYDVATQDRLAAQAEAAVVCARQLRDAGREIRLLEAEVLHLRPHVHQTATLRESNATLSAHNAALSDSHAGLSNDFAWLTTQTATHAADIAWLQGENARLAQPVSQLETLRTALAWREGPRVLQLLLPVARGLRRLSRLPVVLPIGRRLLRAARGARGMIRRRGQDVFPTVAGVSDVSGPGAVAAMVPEPAADPSPIAGIAPPRRIARHAVHQFHPGSSYGDAVTNSMLLTRRILRDLGYASEIYVVHRDPALTDELFLLDDLPLHDEYVLIVLHTLGYDDAARIAALPAPKLLIYHNITPAHLLREIPELARLSQLGRAQLEFWRPRVVGALAVSDYNALELRRHGYSGVGVCPLLFDMDLLKSRPRRVPAPEPDDPYTILFVGRIVESKGQDALVDAFGLFNLRYGRNCRLVLVGRTEGGGDRYLADLYQRIGEQGLRRAVILTGAVSDDELFDWYGRADLYVSLSRHEGFGVPLIEAMAYDVPVIAYATGAVPFTMQENGTAPGIIHSRDPAVVAAAMLQVATDAAHRDTILASQRANLGRFELARHIPVFERALAGAGALPVLKNPRPSFADHLNFTVTGHFNGSYSLAAVNRSLASALAASAPGRVRIQPVEGACTDDLDGVPPEQRPAMRALADARSPAAAAVVVISQHYPVYIPNESRTAADLTVSYFFWEESLVPPATVSCLNRAFDAVFAPSACVAKALIDSGVRLPVKIIGYAPQLTAFFRLGSQRVAARRKPEKFTFLHVSSCFPRKGVDLLLNAYARTFTAADPVCLIIKTFPNPHNRTAGLIEALQARFDTLPEIRLIDRDIDEAALLDLYAQADAAVLPTRGEGFNIPAAEAMAAALPLVVTGGGGSADFVTPDDAILLPWQWAPSRSHLAGGQSLWFAPDEDAIAAALREVFQDVMGNGGAAAARARHARQSVSRRLNPRAWTRRIADIAADILTTTRPRASRIMLVSPWGVACGVAEYTRHFAAALKPLLTPDERLMIVADDRTPAGETAGFAVRPGWTLGGADTAERLAVVISQEDPHVLMIQHQPGLIDWRSLAAWLGDARVAARVVIVTLHTTLHLMSLSVDDRWTALRALRLVARVIVHTLADLNLLHRLGLSANVVMVPHGAPVPTPWPALRPLGPDDAVLIGCYGFLLPQKGLGRLIEAIPAIRKIWPKLQVRFVNALYGAAESTAEFGELQALAERLGVQDCIVWITDFLPHEQSIGQIAGCDLLVLPYLPTVESSSAALRSCLSSGVPVAVTPLPIFDEAGDAVARFDDTDAAAVAAGVIDLLARQDRRDDLRMAAKAWVAARSWDTIATRVHGMMGGLSINRPAATMPPDDTGDPTAPSEILMETSRWN